MTLKRIAQFSSAGILVCAVARVLQILKTIEYKNAFFTEEQKYLGIALSAVMAAACVLVYFLTARFSENATPPIKNTALSVCALFVGIALFAEALYQAFPISVAPWQMGVIRMVTVATAGYFFVVACRGFLNFKIAPMVHVIPICYAFVKTIFTFISVSSLSLISDNVLLMTGYCLLMIFFINYGRLYNGLSGKKSNKILVGAGCTAAVICISQALAFYVVNSVSAEKYLHSDKNVIFTMLCMGLYALIFVASSLKKEN